MSDSLLWSEIVWKIENFSYCWHSVGESITSPVVCIESLRGARWCLQLYPKGLTYQYNLALFLKRMKDSLAERVIRFELAILDNNGFPHTDTIHVFSHSFNEDEQFGEISFLKSYLLEIKKEIYTPGDVLTIQCKIRCKDVNSSGQNSFLLHTHIPVIKCVFPWSVYEGFLSSSESKINLTFPLKTRQTMLVDLEHSDYRNEKHIQMCINGDIEMEYSWICDIRISNTKEKYLFVSGVIDQNCLPYSKRFRPQLLFSNNGNNKKSKLLYELTCVFTIISHKPYKWEEARINIKPMNATEPNISNTSEKEDEVEQKERSLGHVIRQMYCRHLYSDFIVRVQEKNFPVHSIFLTARSPVLSRMLETSMKESVDKTLELEDLDEKTVTQMLEYLYTDDVGVLCTEKALKLYYAGDKYEILGLKEQASSFLKSSLSCSNVCDVLELSDRHQDEHLKLNTVQFIHQHEEEMMKSQEYQKLSESNPKLFIETTFLLAKLKYVT